MDFNNTLAHMTNQETPVTPLQEKPRLAVALGLSSPLYFKREDLHPLGSHKGRSIPHMIDMHAGAGTTHFAISSSGNAALAASLYIKEYNQNNPLSPLTLEIYVGEHINTAKFERLKLSIADVKYPSTGSTSSPQADSGQAISIIQTEKPKQMVHLLNKRGEAKALRQSMDDTALAGYKSLADELAEVKPYAIFIPTSSGTTAQALGSWTPTWESNSQVPQIHIVQTTKCHPIAEEFDKHFENSDISLADAIVDIVGTRKPEVVKVIRESGGSGWIVNDEEIKEVTELVMSKCLKCSRPGLEHFEISPNAVLSIAGLKKALANNWQFEGPVVALITGT